MHLGIDLDNTIMDATTAHLYYYNQVSGKKFSSADVTDFYLYRIYEWDKVESERIYHLYGHAIHQRSQPYPLAVENLKLLYDRCTLSFVTARPQLFQDVTIDWLGHYNISYHNIVFTEDKLQACEQLDVDVLIDDAPHYAEALSGSGRPVILYDQPYNQHLVNESVHRAHNWPEVMAHIETLYTYFQR